MAHTDVISDGPESSLSLAPGTILCDGQFTLTEQIGEGGFGLTYKAEDNVLGRTVVVKECFPEDFCMRHGVNVVPRNQQHHQQYQSIVAMFMREARSLAKLRHPNIVGVHRAFEENNTAYMVLDLIEGEDLFDILQKKAHVFTPKIVEDLLLKLLDAVGKVHEMDLLHRDISPDNIMIDKAGTPVLIDFGAARGDASRKTRAISSLLVVKDGYSPPEFYVAGSPQMPNSDLFALGSSFYHLLTGDYPPNSQMRMTEIASGRPDPCEPLANRIPGYSPAFLEAIDASMKIVPNERLQSAAAWRDLLVTSTKTDVMPDSKAPPRKDPHVKSKDLAAILKQPLTELIAETNTDLQKTRIIDETPPVVEEPKPAARIPDWVAEFNKETMGEDVTSDDDATLVDDPGSMADATDKTSPSRPIQVKRVRTRISEAAPETERRSSGWAIDAIQERERLRKSVPLNVEAAETQIAQPEDEAYLISDIRPKMAPEGWLKPVVRMSLLGVFFGILVFVAASVVLTGSA